MYHLVAACTCGDGCQKCFDDMYSACGGCQDFDESLGPTVKTTAESMGCNGAAQVAPAIFVALAAAVGHFLN